MQFFALMHGFRHTPEACEFADELLYPSTRPVEHLRNDLRRVLSIRAIRDDRYDAAAASGVAVGLHVIALVRAHRPRITVRVEAPQCIELPAVAGPRGALVDDGGSSMPENGERSLRASSPAKRPAPRWPASTMSARQRRRVSLHSIAPLELSVRFCSNRVVPPQTHT